MKIRLTYFTKNKKYVIIYLIKQIWSIGMTSASQADEAGSTPVICSYKYNIT